MKRSKCDEGRDRNQRCCSPLARESNENREWKGVGVVGICRNEVKQENPENNYKYFSVVPQSLSHSRSSEQYPPVWKNPRESVSVSNECITRLSLSLSTCSISYAAQTTAAFSPALLLPPLLLPSSSLSQYFIQICSAVYASSDWVRTAKCDSVCPWRRTSEPSPHSRDGSDDRLYIKKKWFFF